jgi:hypothetical protein
VKADLISLEAETDADQALLHKFAECTAHIASSGGICGEPMTFTVGIKFVPRIPGVTE